MDRSYRKAWRENRSGLAGSLLLHGLFLALWLTWSLAHPAQKPPPLKAMLVDLVHLPAPGESGGGAAPARAFASRVRPAGSPPVTPHGERPDAARPPDPVEARIAGLADLPAVATGTEPLSQGAGYGGPGNAGQGGYGLADYVRAQILRKWWPDLSVQSARAMPVLLTLTLSDSGALSDIRIADQARFAADPSFHDLALSARNAARNASPIALPPGRYPARTALTVVLDPRAALR